MHVIEVDCCALKVPLGGSKLFYFFSYFIVLFVQNNFHFCYHFLFILQDCLFSQSPPPAGVGGKSVPFSIIAPLASIFGSMSSPLTCCRSLALLSHCYWFTFSLCCKAKPSRIGARKKQGSINGEWRRRGRGLLRSPRRISTRGIGLFAWACGGGKISLAESKLFFLHSLQSRNALLFTSEIIVSVCESVCHCGTERPCRQLLWILRQVFAWLGSLWEDFVNTTVLKLSQDTDTNFTGL